MRFKTDENLHPEVAEFLGRDGHDAATVWDEGLQGTKDARIIERCRLEKRALLTLDLGFADIRTYPPADSYGIVVFRLNNQSRGHVLAVFLLFLEFIKTERLQNRLWIVSEDTLRIRGGDSEPED